MFISCTGRLMVPHQREGFASALLWPNWESCSYDNGYALNCSDSQPVSGVACRQGTTPSFSIAISSAQDASNVIKWATANNVKLTIKILSLTHGLNSVTCNLEFVPKNSSTTRVPVLTIGAGAQLSSIYEVAGQQNVSAVLGACPTVGVGRRARRSGDTELRRLNMSYDSSDVSNVTRNLN
ncbi:hypothetical protein EV363DRAFT_1297144 [Boletus edulis]|nr:hypothetical protein EV363DRAFT_1297144 [Boletus edulis]